MAGLGVQPTPKPRAMLPATSAGQAYGGGRSAPAPSAGLMPPPIGRPATPMGPAGSSFSTTPMGTVRETMPGMTTPHFDAGSNSLIQPTGGGWTMEHDPDLTRRARDRSDMEHSLALGQAAGAPSGGGGGGGGGGGEAPAPPPLSTEDIFGVLDRLKGDAPPREAAPTPQNRVAMPTPAAEAPSASMGFARAKDQSGRIGNAALRALKDQMTERGISGSGVEGQLTSNVLGDVARGQSEAGFQQQLEADRQAWDAKQMGYQGDITQRAQDLGLSSAGYSGGIQQRGQDMNQNNLLSMGPTILGLLAGRSRY